MGAKILLLEDDRLFSETLVDFLDSLGYEIECAMDGQNALELANKNRYAIYLLDAKVPLVDGFEFLKIVRDEGDPTPAIFITSANTKEALFRGFQSGCDDYLKKPFDLDELALRIKAILQRGQAMNERIKIEKGVSLSLENHTLEINNKTHKLSPQECELLKLLAFSRGRVVLKDEIYDALWSGKENSSALRVYISKLKDLLGDDKIENIRGVGYLLK